MRPLSVSILRKSAVVLVNNGYTLSGVAALIGCGASTVNRVLRRMADTGTVIDLPRSGSPAIYSEMVKLKLIGFYCQTHPFSNSGRWSLRWAAVHLSVLPEYLVAPSKSTIQRILKANSLKPHQSRYFLHITDPNFFPKMEHLIGLFMNPPKNLFFFDECPGIQILKRLLPDLRTEGMKKRLEEFEYIRNGTIDILAFFNYANGKVFAECQSDHKTNTFIAVFKRQVASCPKKEQLHYVMDNLSTHRGYRFCQIVAELSGVNCPSESELDSLEKRVRWLTSEDKRIVIHFTPYHGSWLNLVEFWFGILNKKVLNESYGSAEELIASFESFLEAWNSLFAHPFRWSYDGKGLHKKAVDRFTKILHQAAKEVEITSLTKQLKLMFNLLLSYASEVSPEYWRNLLEALQSEKVTLREKIMSEEGPKKKKNADEALNLLLPVLEDWVYQNKQKIA
ncbi:MAG: IS630 family transposase [SAR324 cluster bacterium]|nr:IS630 family transposase [SAR324 cluster bacterium]